MKYGEKLVEQSVPKWSLYNIDYNSLKHEIKVHTSRDQAKAIAIPGHENTALARFEGRLYVELCKQHERVDLFVMTKSDEIMRKLEHLAELIQRLIIRCNQETTMTVRRQRKLVKYERELLQCGDDIAALQRFVNAQVTAFRKILKKYKKWTGSTALGARFRENVLRNPKSFTRRDFEHLQMRYNEILNGLHDATPTDTEDSSPSSPIVPTRNAPNSPQSSRQYDGEMGADEPESEPIRYWNEYDDGSECGENDEYVIYVNPDDDDDFVFPGFAYLTTILQTPFKTARSWFSRRSRNDARTYDDLEHQSLLPNTASGSATDSDDWSCDDSPSMRSAASFTPYGTLWFDRQQQRRVQQNQQLRYYHQNRDRVLAWATVGSFAAALTLLVVEAMMLGTGRAEVDAAIAVAAMASMFFAAGGLWSGVWLRGEQSVLTDEEDESGMSPELKLVVWATFAADVLLNIFILGVVVSNLGVYMGFWGFGATGAA